MAKEKTTSKKGLGAALSFIQSKYKAEDDVVYNPDAAVESIGSGSVIIDCVTGVGGFLVKGKMTEIAAPESSGKTTLCLQTCAAAQKAGWVGVFLDVEQAYDNSYAKKLGVKLDNETFTVLQPTYGEMAENLINMIVNKSQIDYLVIDSVAAMKPENQLFAEDSTGKGQVKGGHAMFWANFAPKLQMLAKENHFAVLMTNQVRRKINMGGMFEEKAVSTMGLGTGFSNDDSWITTGGEALKFYLSMRYLLNVKKKYRVQQGDTKIHIGNVIEIANIKNKLSSPYAKSRFLIRFKGGFGTDDMPMIFDVLKAEKLIEVKGGGTYVLADTDYCPSFEVKGMDNFIAKMGEPSIKPKIEALYKAVYDSMDNIDEEDASKETKSNDDIDIEIEEDDLDD